MADDRYFEKSKNRHIPAKVQPINTNDACGHFEPCQKLKFANFENSRWRTATI